MIKEKDRLAVQNMAILYYAILYSADCVLQWRVVVQSLAGPRTLCTILYSAHCVVVESCATPGRPTNTVYYTLQCRLCVVVGSSSGKPGRPTHTVYYTLKCRLCVVVESSSAKPGKSTLYYTLTSGLCGSGKFCKTCQAAQNHRLPASPPAKSSNLESRGKEKHFKGEKKGKKYTKRLIERCVGTGTKS